MLAKIVAVAALIFQFNLSGSMKTQAMNRIVNGTNAPPGKYSAMVSYQNMNRHSCGGTILNEYWVLTAAHCVDGDVAANMSIKAGTTDLKYGGIRHQAAELVIHEDYDRYTLEHDIGLVRVIEPFVFDAWTLPIKLPSKGQQTHGGLNATVVGWGLPSSGGQVMRRLQEVDYWTVSDDYCRDIHESYVFDTNICAYYPGGGKGQCTGDSGGPLLVNGEQVGIVSWSEKPCTVAPYPGVFTEVEPYLTWIISHITNNHIERNVLQDEQNLH